MMRKIDSKHVFGRRSTKCVVTTHPDMQQIMKESIRRCPVDFGVHEGARSDQKQLEYFLAGKSRIDPRVPELKAKGKHLISEEFPKARAVDFHIAEKYGSKSLTWNEVHLAFVAGYMISVSHELYEQNKIDHVLRWGGDWDSDGIIALDHTLKDLPHVELVRP